MTLVNDEREIVSESVVAAWNAVRENLRRDVGARNFDHWLARISLGGYGQPPTARSSSCSRRAFSPIGSPAISATA